MRATETDEPEAQVGRDLIVPRSTGVQLAPDVLAHDFGQATLVGRVDVLVVGLRDELRSHPPPGSATATARELQMMRSDLAGPPLFRDLSEPALDLFLLVLGEDADVEEGLGVGDRPLDVNEVHPLVVSQALLKPREQGRGRVESGGSPAIGRARARELTLNSCIRGSVLPATIHRVSFEC